MGLDGISVAVLKMSFQKIQACFCVYRISFKRSNILITTMQGLIDQNIKIRYTSFIHASCNHLLCPIKIKSIKPSMKHMTNKNIFQFIPSIFQAFKRSIIPKTKKLILCISNCIIFQSFNRSSIQKNSIIQNSFKRSSVQAINHSKKIILYI